MIFKNKVNILRCISCYLYNEFEVESIMNINYKCFGIVFKISYYIRC